MTSTADEEIYDILEEPWRYPTGMPRGFYVVRFGEEGEFVTSLGPYRDSDRAFSACNKIIQTGRYNRRYLRIGVRYYDGRDMSDWGEEVL